LDGRFGDWDGKAGLEDPPGDAHGDACDLVGFSWDQDPDGAGLYFMAQRSAGAGAGSARYQVLIDTDDDGRFDGPRDGRVEVEYAPASDGVVRVQVYRGVLQTATYSGPWGEDSAEGGLRCEWHVQFSSLGVEAGQIVRFEVFSARDTSPATPVADLEDLAARRLADRFPDEGDIQLAPIPTAPAWWVAVPLLLCCFAAAFAAARRRGRPGTR
jgi:hypothetical protein